MPKSRRRNHRRPRAAPAALPRRVPAAIVPADPDPADNPILAEWERELLGRQPEPEPPLPAELTYPRPFDVEEQTGGRDDTALTSDLAAKLRQIPTCQHCGGRHARACPRVRRMAFHPNGALASVEFWADGKWSDDDIIWPEELPDE